MRPDFEIDIACQLCEWEIYKSGSIAIEFGNASYPIHCGHIPRPRGNHGSPV